MVVVTMGLFWLGGILALFSAYLTGSYIFRGVTADGISGTDYIIGIGCGAGCLAVLVAYHYIGTHVLPNLPKGQRAGPIAVFVVTAFLIFGLSTTSNFLEVTRAPVEMAEQNRLRETAQERYSQSAKAARELEVTIPIVRAARENADGLLEDELRRGAVCGRGAGLGECASQTRALSSTLADAEATLVNIVAVTTRLTRRGADILDDIGRISAHEDLSWIERDAAIKRRLEDLSLVTDEINQALPVSAVVGVADAMQKPWAQVGFTPEGAARMTGTFAPIASRLIENTRDLRAIKYRAPVDLTPKTGMSAAMAHMDKVGVQAALALLLDTLPLFAILILVVVQWQRQDQHTQTELSLVSMTKPRNIH
ncbi:MAG: hypothetical protein AAGC95_05190 [Pseudomonadota bacterium]